MNKRLEKKMNKKANSDPLMGAPGHTSADMAPSSKKSDSSKSMAKEDRDQDSSQETASEVSDDAGSVDSVLSSLGSVFGEENIDKLKTLIEENSRNAEEKIMKFLRSITPNTEDMRMPKLSDAKKHPVAAASAVAAGIGTVFLLRAYLKNGNTENEETQDSGNKAKKKQTSVARKASSKTSKGTKASKAKSSAGKLKKR